MIDFACKEFKIEDVIKCALNLTRADLKVMKFFFNEPGQWLDSDFLAKTLKLDTSTVQRSVKRLSEKGVLQRSQKNLDGGGYVFIYRIQSKKEIKKILMDVVQAWADRVGQELEQWEKQEVDLHA